MIELTRDEANAIAEFIKWWLYEAIRNKSIDNADWLIDNVDWLKDIWSVYEKCTEGVKNEER